MLPGVWSQDARMFAVNSPGANDAFRWSMFTQSAVVAASSCRLIAEKARATTDQVCA